MEMMEKFITPGGGMLNYSYTWTGPNGFSSTNEDIIGINSGNYSITVTDSTGCSSTDLIYIDEPSSLSIQLDSITNLLCFEECNGQIMITANGGDSIYTYLWIGPNGFTSTDEDLEVYVLETMNLFFLTLQVLFQQRLQCLTFTTTNNYLDTLQVMRIYSAFAFSYGGQFHILLGMLLDLFYILIWNAITK